MSLINRCIISPCMFWIFQIFQSQRVLAQLLWLLESWLCVVQAISVMKMLILTNRCITLVFSLICVVLEVLWAKFYALGALYLFISLWSSCKLWDGFQPPISQMLNCVLLSNYLQEVLVGQSPQVKRVLHGIQTKFFFIFFSPPLNAKFQTDSKLRSWPYPSFQLLILIDSNLSNPAFVAYTLL